MAFRTALVTLFDGDSTVQTLTGRTSRNLLAEGTVSETPYPLVVYRVISGPKLAGTSGRRRIRMQVTAWADGREATTDPIQTVESLMDRADALFTGASLNGESIGAAVNPLGNRRDAPSTTQGIVGLSDDYIIDLDI
jgi:hypothetical protein